MFSSPHPHEPAPAFGRRGGGGRRVDGRTAAGICGVIRTLLFNHAVEVTDVSESGARLAGPGLPSAGQELFLRIGGIELFARVVWSRDELCGVAFDESLAPAELERLREETRRTRLMQLTPEQKQAFDQWVSSSR